VATLLVFMQNQGRQRTLIFSSKRMRKTAKQFSVLSLNTEHLLLDSARRTFETEQSFQIGQPPARIDLLQSIDGVSFEEAWEHRIEGLIDVETPTIVISKEDLIKNKLATGRERDLLDVKELQAADASVPKKTKKNR
jgi:hypothetical protein